MKVAPKLIRTYDDGEIYYYLPQQELDALANQETPLELLSQQWETLSTIGGQATWNRKTGSGIANVYLVQLKNSSTCASFISDEWMRRDAIVKAEERAEEMEKEINSPWNVERAALKARRTIADFKSMPSYEQRQLLLDAWFDSQEKQEFVHE